MSNQLQITGGAKVRNLEGVLTGTSGVVSSLGINVPSGIPQLDGSGKILVSQLPNSVMEYKGTWDAATNTPTLADGTGNQGDVYLCNVAGTVDFGSGPITFYVGDQVIYSGTIWQRASGSTGTVTSVAVTESGDALTITGSPITTSGTINIGFAGTTGQYVNGAGGLTTFPSLTGYVPYTGATGNVDLGEYGLTSGYYGFDLTPTSTPTTQGTMSWNVDNESVDLIMNGVTGSLLQDTFYNVKNQTGTDIPKGTVVMAVGTLGASGRILIAPFLADGTYDSKFCMGVTAEDILNGGDGKVTAFGAIRKIDTSAFTNGDILYASPTTAGAFTTTQPTNPNNIVTVAIVVYADATNGEIFVRPTFVNSATDIANALGYTPANAATYVPYTGATTNLNLGNYSLTGYTVKGNAGLFVEGYGGEGYSLAFKQYAVNNVQGLGYTSIGANDTNILSFYFAQSTAYTGKSFKIDVSGLTDNVWRTYQMPNADGTLALTSQIPTSSTYVDLTSAQTITGIKTFSNETLFGNGITLTGGYITYTSGAYNLTLNTNILTANRNVFLQDGSGTLAFTSDIPSLSGYVQGSGTTNYHAKFTGTSTIGNSMLTDDGTTLQSIGATRSNLYLKAASSSYYSQLAFTNGTNGSFGGISYNNSGQYMQFETNSSEWMRLTDIGNLGIGTTSPSTITTGAKVLQVTGSSYGFVLATSGSVIAQMIGDAGGNVAFGSRSNHSLTLTTNDVERMRITTSGNVGIGTSSPINRLVVSNGGANGFEFDAPNGTLLLYNRSTSAYSTLNFNASEIVSYISGTERMRITSSGNVGIGTSSPSAPLEIYHNSGNTLVLSKSTNYPFLAWKGATYTNGIESGDNYMAFYQSGSERMRITSSGNVLVGTTTDNGIAPFQVSSNATFGGGAPISFTNIGTGTYNRTVIYNNTSEGFQIDLARTTDSISGTPIPFKVTVRGGTEFMRITSGGVTYLTADGIDQLRIQNASDNNRQLLIGYDYTNNYASIQSVQQTIAYRTLYLNKNGGAVYAGSVRLDILSDERVKDNIQNIDGALNKVLSITGKKFHLKDEEEGKLRYGFIAQELEGILDEFVIQTDMTFKKDDLEVENVKSVENWASSWSALLVEAIKEQQKIINQLSAKITALENKIN